MLRSAFEAAKTTEGPVLFVDQEVELVSSINTNELERLWEIRNPTATDSHDLGVSSDQAPSVAHEFPQRFRAVSALDAQEEHEHNVAPLELR
jgi:hypothetical protein